MLSRWLTPRPSAYAPVWADMRAFTEARTADTPDEIWLTEHAPVYTLGQAGKPEHLADAILIGKADAALIASMVHYGEYTISGIKEHLARHGIRVRTCAEGAAGRT